MSNGKKGLLSANRVVLTGIALVVLYWLMESILVDVLLFHEGSVADRLLPLSDAHELWARALVSTLLIAFGVVAQNIYNKQERAEEELRTSEERFRALAHSSTDVIAIVDAEGNVTYESGAVEKVLGHEPGDLVGRNGFASVHPDDIPMAQKMFRELLSTPGATRPAEVRVRHRDGSWRCLEVTGTNLLHEPDINGIVANYRDVTERKRAEEALREAELRYRTLAERIPAVTYIQYVGNPSRTTYVSPQMETMLGYKPEECTSDPEHWLKVMHPADREWVLAADRRTDERGEPFRAEFRQFAKDGRVVWVRDEATLIRDAEGSPSY